MTIPSGTGTEVLKRATSIGTTNNLNSLTTVLTVATDHIYMRPTLWNPPQVARNTTDIWKWCAL